MGLPGFDGQSNQRQAIRGACTPTKTGNHPHGKEKAIPLAESILAGILSPIRASVYATA